MLIDGDYIFFSKKVLIDNQVEFLFYDEQTVRLKIMINEMTEGIFFYSVKIYHIQSMIHHVFGVIRKKKNYNYKISYKIIFKHIPSYYRYQNDANVTIHIFFDIRICQKIIDRYIHNYASN